MSRQKSQTSKSKQRQPAAHRLSLSRALEPLKNQLRWDAETREPQRDARTGSRKKASKKTRSRQYTQKRKSLSVIKLIHKKPSKPARRKQRQFSVLLTHSTKLVITIKPVRQTQKRKKTARMSVWPYLPLSRSTAISTALIIVGLLGTVYFGWHSVFASSPATASISRGTVPAANRVGNHVKRTHYPKSQPTQLSIPAIEVNTSITTVGKNSDGSITVPPDYRTAGWYQYSPTPGEIGPSVIVGHLDNVSGVAVFWRLHELVPGNEIQVTRADGQTLKFTVNSVKQFPQDAFPTKEVYGNINYAGLRLITCGGTFNRLTHHYDQNTVVYASLNS